MPYDRDIEYVLCRLPSDNDKLGFYDFNMRCFNTLHIGAIDAKNMLYHLQIGELVTIKARHPNELTARDDISSLRVQLSCHIHYNREIHCLSPIWMGQALNMILAGIHIDLHNASSTDIVLSSIIARFNK